MQPQALGGKNPHVVLVLAQAVLAVRLSLQSAATSRVFRSYGTVLYSDSFSAHVKSPRGIVVAMRCGCGCGRDALVINPLLEVAGK